MNEIEAHQVIAAVSGAYGRGFRPESIDEWTRHLARRDYSAARAALDRIIANGEPGPSIARLLAEISAATPRRVTNTAGLIDCPNCHGLGFESAPPEINDPPGTQRLAKCHSCRTRTTPNGPAA